MTPAPLTLSLTLDTDWGAATGAGIAGGVDNVVEKDSSGRPVLRATILTGIMREQALNAARALDGPEGTAWQNLARALFGTADHPRLITFSDAPIAAAEEATTQDATHTVIGVSIDERTGTAKEDFLRLFERAGRGSGEARIDLLTESLDRSPITWSPAQRGDARLLLALAAQLVRAVGSDRTSGDGACRAVVTDGDTVMDRTWCATQVRSLMGEDGTVRAPEVPERTRSAPAIVSDGAPTAAPTMAATARLTMSLRAPLVSYEVPYSNEVRSLDFLRGTVLLPWVHSRLRRALPDNPLVRDAVVRGHLRLSDATPVVDGVRGLPVPLVLSREKQAGQDGGEITLWNRLRSEEPTQVHVPVRSGYLFDTGTTVHLGSPALVGRQSTAIFATTGAAEAGQLFMVRALPAGVVLQAQVTMSAELRDAVGQKWEEILSIPARLGSRRLSGTYGRVDCVLDPVEDVPEPDLGGEQEEALTIWCVSDILLRSPGLGATGGVAPLLEALGAGTRLRLVPDPDTEPEDLRYAVGLRHRRVDTWSATAQQPRTSRIAVQAGTALRVAPQDPAQMGRLRAYLAVAQREGIGHLREQGYGRIVVGHRLLELKKGTFEAQGLRQADFTSEGQEQ
ncbi:RAMP superfamily CRISPR-associated protein [Actinomyces oricola]|uniref:RAMP superfamily CRISPR-associated protein n=1 Tax=Actinomyces oricola TaxID=206043 RepID=UPI000FFE902A|nr:RAMP superfamily CRISPR-associated protein [Actinomyces oricola]